MPRPNKLRFAIFASLVTFTLSPFQPNLRAAPLAAGAPVAYTTFQGQQLQRFPWFGENIVILTANASLDPNAMSSLVSAVDRAYAVYAQITGRTPQPFGPTVLAGRSIVAEVPDGTTCGGACSYLGFTGTEITTTSFLLLYEGIRLRGEYDQAEFYELGRNFWFYQNQLGALDPFVTGFAIANRFVSMEQAGLQGGPFNGILPFGEFKSSIVTDLLNGYLANAGLDWRNTLLVNVGPPNPHGWGAADLAGAMMYRIYTENGFQEYGAFWRTLARLPLTSTPEVAVRNFILAAFAVTGRHYGFFFKDIFVVPASATGLWSGAWEPASDSCTSDLAPTFTLDLAQHGDVITGKLSAPGVESAPISGRIVINAAQMEVHGEVQATLTAVISGRTMTGLIEENPRPGRCARSGSFRLSGN
ncbi:MAG: hypothetical protein JWO48_3774 [Bryobacterales bacterium]|nr:hypothetical protein [Bryobacterales bacterium]